MRNYICVLASCVLILAGCADFSTRVEQLKSNLKPANAVRFKVHIIEDGIREGYKTAIADVNLDGRPDILLTTMRKSEPAWYENPTWDRHLISDALEVTPFILTASDIEGDETPEMFTSAGFSPINEDSLGKIYKLRSNNDPKQLWQYELFDTIFMAHRMYFADLDNDGKSELVVAPIIGSPTKPMAEYDASTPLYYYQSETFKKQLVNDNLHGTVHGMEIAKWDGQDAILTAGFDGIWLHRANGTDSTGKINFKSEHITKGKWSNELVRRGSSDVQLGILPNGGKFIASIEPFHGDLVVIYTQNNNGDPANSWDRHLIDDSLSHGHALVTGDFNDDGFDELIASGDNADDIYIYYALDASGSAWRREEILDDFGAQGCSAADFNLDSRLDFVCVSNSSKQFRWYENLGE